jgi:hypothetical protein
MILTYGRSVYSHGLLLRQIHLTDLYQSMVDTHTEDIYEQAVSESPSKAIPHFSTLWRFMAW